MSAFFKELHHRAEDFEVVPFRNEPKLVLLEERNDYRLKFFPPEDLKSITMLMVRAGVFLEIDTTAAQEILECVENVFIFLDEFYIEFWFYHDPSNDLSLHIWIPHIDREASFTIYEPDNIIGI